MSAPAEASPSSGKPRILAGAPARDRLLVADPGSSTRWFEPMHVREPARVRDEMAAQVAAGADILVAPTWLTHRRALVAVGETRRARAWTDLAVSVARQAAEIGRERLESDRAVGIVGVLPDPDAVDEEATGQRLRPDAAAERDERAQVGLLAEAGVEAIIIGARHSLARTRVALRAVAETGCAAWTVLPDVRADGLSLAAWVEALAAESASVVLLLGSVGNEPIDARFGVLAPGPLGVADRRGAVDRRATAAAWLEAGAAIIGVAADATPDALRPLVEARDAAIAAERQAGEVTRADIDLWVREATQRAPGGKALWVGDPPPSLPDGFAWTVVRATAIDSLPPATWQLLISVGVLDPRDGARLVEQGGIIAASAPDPDTLATLARAAGVRLETITKLVNGECRYLGRLEG